MVDYCPCGSLPKNTVPVSFGDPALPVATVSLFSLSHRRSRRCLLAPNATGEMTCRNKTKFANIAVLLCCSHRKCSQKRTCSCSVVKVTAYGELTSKRLRYKECQSSLV